MKNLIANISARLLRASLTRISSDLELLSETQAAYSSAEYINRYMYKAKPCNNGDEVLQLACDVAKQSVEGHIIELGVYKGTSLKKLGTYFKNQTVDGFDTFTGLPEAWRHGFQSGTFDVSSENIDVPENCKLHKGLFDETLPFFIKRSTKPARLIHVDCDLYSSTASAFNILSPIIMPGTVILFDEFFNYPGWQEHEFKAFNEFMEKENRSCQYLAYNKIGQQVAIIMTS